MHTSDHTSAVYFNYAALKVLGYVRRAIPLYHAR